MPAITSSASSTPTRPTSRSNKLMVLADGLFTSVTAKPTGTSPAACKAIAISRSTTKAAAQAAHCGEVLARSVGASEAATRPTLDFVSSPLGRATETMELVRPALGLARARLSARAAPDRNCPSATGKARPSRSCTRTIRCGFRSASTTSGISCRRAAKAMRWSRPACAVGTTASPATRVATAHGGTARGLMACLRHRQAGRRPADRYHPGRGLCVSGR